MSKGVKTKFLENLKIKKTMLAVFLRCYNSLFQLIVVFEYEYIYKIKINFLLLFTKIYRKLNF
jgi:hypothetical protein